MIMVMMNRRSGANVEKSATSACGIGSVVKTAQRKHLHRYDK